MLHQPLCERDAITIGVAPGESVIPQEWRLTSNGRVPDSVEWQVTRENNVVDPDTAVETPEVKDNLWVFLVEVLEPVVVANGDPEDIPARRCRGDDCNDASRSQVELNSAGRRSVGPVGNL